jgi:NADH-quinone oxidoreductase subunit M
VVAAGFLLWAFQRAFLAHPPEGTVRDVERASSLEWTIAGVLVAVLLVAGFHMSPWLDLVEAPMKALAGRWAHG